MDKVKSIPNNEIKYGFKNIQIDRFMSNGEFNAVFTKTKINSVYDEGYGDYIKQTKEYSNGLNNTETSQETKEDILMYTNIDGYYDSNSLN